MLSGLVAKQLSRRNVVETGIRARVRMSSTTGAAICKYENDVGAVSKPFDARRW